MPILKGISKDPLDINKNVEIGVGFPLNEVNMFKGTETVIEQTKANLINLLMTHPGERLNLPYYGIGLKTQLFENQPDIKFIQENINEQVARYIPNIQVQEVNTTLSEDGHSVFVSVTYIYLLDGSVNNIQLNFK
tara:strand:- start:518 stop:922 length:405 start_codon:yes stop_codon:yes gene_type:complete